MNLSAIQSVMGDWLRTGDPACANQFGDSARPGLEVYLNTYRMQLLQCLAEVYPKTLEWLGDERFYAAARQHIMAQPPTSWTLDAYPASFAASITSLCPGDAVTAELVQLEHALDECQTAADLAPLTRAMFTRLDWEYVELSPAAGAQLLVHHSNAEAIWSALARLESRPAGRTTENPAHILVWRSGWVPCFRVLDINEAAFFERLLIAPMSFTAVCAGLEQQLGQRAAIERAGLLLARWADEGSVCANEVQRSESWLASDLNK